MFKKYDNEWVWITKRKDNCFLVKFDNNGYGTIYVNKKSFYIPKDLVGKKIKLILKVVK